MVPVGTGPAYSGSDNDDSGLWKSRRQLKANVGESMLQDSFPGTIRLEYIISKG
jgi:hypothetical protein